MPEETPKAGYFTPMLHATDIARSIRFYELLGFQTVDTDRGEPLGWARMHCEGGAIMFLGAEEGHPVDTSKTPVLFYLYAPDLPALREHLLANGIAAPPIKHPDYMPSGEMYLQDPDGYRVAICHWSETEHTEWLKRIKEEPRRASA